MSNTAIAERPPSTAGVPGARTPRLVMRDTLDLMEPSSVIVEFAIDQDGCFETARPTTHADPVYEFDGVVDDCVANMPGIVPATPTNALTNTTFPYVRALADHGSGAALGSDVGFDIRAGEITYPPVADAYAYEPGVAV